MEKWFARVTVFLLVIFSLLCLGAKIHFFTRYGAVGLGEYLEEHWFFWAGMAIVAGAVACLDWIRKRLEHPRSK